MDVYSYNACVKEWADALFRFAYKCTSHEEDARDVVQNAFAVLWEKRSDVLPEKAKAYLFQLAYRKSVDTYRKRGKLVYSEVEHPEYSTTANPDLKRILERALAQLDEQSRALVLLKDYEGYRYEEIAQITGLNESQVKVYLHRARKVLKTYLVNVENII